MATKYYLDQPGLERLVDYINNSLNNKANVGDVPENVVVQTDLAEYAKKSDIPEGQDLSGYATKAELEDYATAADLDELEGKVTGVYHFRGSVADLEALQAIEDPAEGDVYNIEATGMNAAWTGEMWDEFGTTVDLSDYMLSDDVQAISIPVVDSILYGGSFAVVSDASGMAAMIANDEPEVEIVLKKSLSNADMISIPEGKKVTLDLGGNSISGNSWLVNVAGGEVVLKNGEIESIARPVYVSSGTVTLDGATVISQNDVAINASGANAEVVINSGKVEAQESGVLVTSGASVVVNGGEIECTDNCPLQGNGTKGQGDVNMVMNGGKLIAHITSAGYTACGVYMPNSGSFTMNGGEIISDGAGVVMRGGEVNLNGGSIVANGVSGSSGKVGDSRVVVGPYAVVYDSNSKYPAKDTLQLNIAAGMELSGTDGDIQEILEEGTNANIIDNR